LVKRKKPACFGIKFNQLKKCKNCPFLQKCGEKWIRDETDAFFNEIRILLRRQRI